VSDALAVKQSDLGLRTLSAVAMLVVAGGSLWLGGWAWIGFVGFVALVTAYEWKELVRKFAASRTALYLWLAGGVAYIGFASATLVYIRGGVQVDLLLLVLMMVIGTDIGAYTLGRLIGGPKIAPKISPSKTWAGLAGGILGAALFGLVVQVVQVGLAVGGPVYLRNYAGDMALTYLGALLLAGAIVAPVAQAGDFFESWMKRRAGAKDSGRLLPGHGGVFDRVDGLMAVSVLLGVLLLAGLYE
jgi:phosphatidate cytidylyltransferase